jgi:hypothetical protein
MTAKEIAAYELNECLRRIQKRLGAEYGDFAGAFFTGEKGEALETAEGLLAEYTAAEIGFAEPPEPTHLHGEDVDCTLNSEDVCVVCGVWHGDPCPECGGRGFHASDCNLR